MDPNAQITIVLPFGDLLTLDDVLATTEVLSARVANTLRDRIREQVRAQAPQPQLSATAAG